MDLNDSPQEASFRTRARAFLDAHATPSAPSAARTTALDNDAPVVLRAKEWQACKKDNGWACLTWPEEYGGRGRWEPGGSTT